MCNTDFKTVKDTPGNHADGKKRFLFLLLIVLAFSCRLPVKEKDIPFNIILIIGDGMGKPHLSAASSYAYGTADSLSFQGFPVKTSVKTSSASFAITDSAAASTAMATGRKVRNRVISLRIPGSRKPLPTMLEIFRDSGKRTGLVTNTYLTHATPAGFAAHTENRGNHDKIARDYLYESRPDIMLGGGGFGLSLFSAEAAGYKTAASMEELSAILEESDGKSVKICGLFGKGNLPYAVENRKSMDYPALSELVSASLEFLDNRENGFFLMIESGRIDHAAHANNLETVIYEVLELSYTVEKVLEWAEGRRDTLVVVTADHETGGLVLKEPSEKGKLPSYRWRTKGHTAAEVPLYAWGYNAEKFDAPVIDNTDIFRVLTLGKNFSQPPGADISIEYSFGFVKKFK